MLVTVMSEPEIGEIGAGHIRAQMIDEGQGATRMDSMRKAVAGGDDPGAGSAGLKSERVAA